MSHRRDTFVVECRAGRAQTLEAGNLQSFTTAGGRVWLTDPAPWRALRQVDLDFQAIGGLMRKPYESPRLVVYGPIADCTFLTPGGATKGCQTVCHLDKFGENSSLSG